MKKLLILSVLFFSVTVLNAQVTPQTPVTELVRALKATMSEINDNDFNSKMYLQLEQRVLDLETHENDLTASQDVLLSNAKTMLFQRQEAYKKETPGFFTGFYKPAELKTALVEYLKDIIDENELKNKMTMDDLIANAEYKMSEDENANTEETRNLKVKLFPYYVEKVSASVKKTNNVMCGSFEVDIINSMYLLSYVFDNLEATQPDMEMVFYYTDKLSKIIDLSATTGDQMYRIAKSQYKHEISTLKAKVEGIRAVK